MKYVITFLALFLIAGKSVFAQVGINTDNSAPDPTTMLDVKSTNRGLLIPRISTSARNMIPSPATGLLIYNTTINELNYYNGSYWHQILSIRYPGIYFGDLSVEGVLAINISTGVQPENSAMVDVNNPTRGILIPRTTPNLITSPATGLIIYNISTNQLNYYDGNQWKALCSFSTGITGAGGSQNSIGVAISMDNSSPHHSAMLDVSATDKGVLIPRLTNTQRDSILPALGLIIYNSSSNAIQFNRSSWAQLINTNSITSPTEATHIPLSTQIIWNWNLVFDPATGFATGYKWNTENNYFTATDMGTSTSKTETGLSCEVTYTRYVWAYNDCGFSTATALNQTTSLCTFSCGFPIIANHIAGNVAPVTKTVTYGTVANIPGESSKCWITSNLGADHQAIAQNDASEASAGWYWQFNFKQGYKVLDNGARTPPTGWLYPIWEDSDWIYTNDPCAILLGGGWRLPTSTEWTNVDDINNGNWTDWNGPWNSGLKMHAAGTLKNTNGSLLNRGVGGYYWSNTTAQGNEYASWALTFWNNTCYVAGIYKSAGLTVRCIRD